MCLYKVDKKTKKASFGWRVFAKSEQYPDYKYIESDIFHHGQNNRLIPTERWIKDQKENKICSRTNEYYQTGFHVFRSYKQAQKWRESNQVICKVLIQDIVASGFQRVICDKPMAIVFVARRIYIEKPE